MTLHELKRDLIAYAKDLIPPHLQELIHVVGTPDANSLAIQNLKTKQAQTVLDFIKQGSVSVYISRKESLAGALQLESFTFPPHRLNEEIRNFIELSEEEYVTKEKFVIQQNITKALETPTSALFNFLRVAREMGFITTGTTSGFTPQKELYPNPLHDSVLKFMLDYRNRHPEFIFWLRERNTKNRLNEGYWFQGTKNYAFVGLFNTWSGNFSTKGFGLAFWPTPQNDIGVTFELIYRQEEREGFLAFYEEVLRELRRVYPNALKGENDNHYWIILSDRDAFSAASEFLDKFYQKFLSLTRRFPVSEVILVERDLVNKLRRIEEIRQRIDRADPALNLGIGNVESSEEPQGIDGLDEIEIHAPGYNNTLRLQQDSATKIDLIGRQGFVNAIFEHVNRLWETGEMKGSYTLHINGEWGSGKSTILELLKDKLESSERASDGWVVVEFNAWQNQHLQFPWWVFLDKVYETIKENSKWLIRKWISIKEFWWRTVTMYASKWITFSIFLGVFLITFFGAGFDSIADIFSDSTDKKVSSILSLISLVGTIWLFFYGIIKTLIIGGEEAAKSYKENVKDPMAKIKLHYDKVVRYTNKNVAVFIDDLDRCDPKFVVQLLEGMQTLFRNQKVFYVIAGDGNWIRQSFEIQYANFKNIVKNPGQSLGNFFVEKSLQQSITVPPLTAELKKIFWRKLLNNESMELRSEQYATSIERLVNAKDSAGIDEIISQSRTDEEKTVLRQKAAELITSKEAVKELEHEFLKYYELLDANPRKMKRIVNNLALEKAVLYLSGRNNLVDEETLIRWAIIKDRFPLIAHEIYRSPENLSKYRNDIDYPDMKILLSGVNDDALKQLIA